MSANALIIGTGGVGSVVGQKLHGYACFERIYLGDVDTTYAQRLHERTPKSRFEVVAPEAVTRVEVDPDRVLMLDVNYTNNSWTAHPVARQAATRWGLRWLTWAQELLLTYAFLV